MFCCWCCQWCIERQVGEELRWHNSWKASLRHGWPRYHLQASRIAGAHLPPSRFYSHNSKITHRVLSAPWYHQKYVQTKGNVCKMRERLWWKPRLDVWSCWLDSKEFEKTKKKAVRLRVVCRSGSREDKSWMIHWFFSHRALPSDNPDNTQWNLLAFKWGEEGAPHSGYRFNCCFVTTTSR